MGDADDASSKVGDATDEASAPPASYCTLPPELRCERLVSYDLKRYPFPALLSELLAPEPAGTLLGLLHKTAEAQNWLQGMHRNESRPYAMRRNIFDSRLKTSTEGFRADSQIAKAYQSFVRNVVQPLVDLDGSGLLYQAEPNVRIHIPGTGHLLVHRHKDADYHHNPNEINFWVPCTAAFGSNTVHAESEPGLEDFHPFELEPGQMMQFYGHQCAHYTVPNETDTCRVSFGESSNTVHAPHAHWAASATSIRVTSHYAHADH
jgi:hypothetical protein